MDYIRLNEIKIEGNVAKYYFSAPRKFIKFLKTEQEPFLLSILRVRIWTIAPVVL